MRFHEPLFWRKGKDGGKILLIANRWGRKRIGVGENLGGRYGRGVCSHPYGPKWAEIIDWEGK